MDGSLFHLFGGYCCYRVPPIEVLEGSSQFPGERHRLFPGDEGTTAAPKAAV